LSSEKASKVLAALEEGIRKDILGQREASIYAFKHPEKQAECPSSFSEKEQAMH
jgi:hypothetical protein